MASETLDEAKTADPGASEPEDREEKEVTAGGEEEETKEEEKEEEAKEEEEEEQEEEATPKRGRKRGSPEKEEWEGAEEKKQRSRRRSTASEGVSPVERPLRERKSVERYSALSPRKVSATKVVTIAQGSGTKIKDIPNASFKLSKRRIDENLQLLHTILFGKKATAHFLKRNIFQFSGFVWSANEEKQRAKVKEKLDKCTKDKLLDFCDLLDIHILRATTKKEEISAKLLEFLESPHVTRDVLLAEKDKKGKKRGRRPKGVSQSPSEEAPSDGETKKHKKSSGSERKKERRDSAKADKEEEEEGGSTDMKDASSDEDDNVGSEEESEHVKSEEEGDDDEPENNAASKKGSNEKQADKVAKLKLKEKAASAKKSLPAKSDKRSLKPVPKKASTTAGDEPNVADNSQQGSSKEPTKKGSKAITKEKGTPISKEDKKKYSRKSSSVDGSDSTPPSSSKAKGGEKKKGRSHEQPAVEDKKASKKKEAKSGPKGSSKEQGKGKGNTGPTAEELHSVVSNILREVDFNTATLADILKQLGVHFDMDLMDRKAEVKRIIEDVINNMTDDEESEDD